LLATPEFGRDPVQRAWVLPLHGALPAEEQRRVFERPPPGAIKVVLATNVAETSITIDDVGFVIDAGRVKEERYDAERRIGSLEDVLVSAAAAKQRRGRAGRVCPGLAVHLYPSDIKQAAFQVSSASPVDVHILSVLAFDCFVVMFEARIIKAVLFPCILAFKPFISLLFGNFKGFFRRL
jgi:HrpA-like RNA helicase